jgi:ribonuclease P protein component
VLAPENRLRLTREHRRTVRHGVRGGGRLLAVHVLGSAHAAPTRAGFVVNRAVGGAVTRNAVRRRLRHLVRDRLDRLPAGSLVVVRAQPGAATVASAQLGRELDVALDRVLPRWPDQGQPDQGQPARDSVTTGHGRQGHRS